VIHLPVILPSGELQVIPKRTTVPVQLVFGPVLPLYDEHVAPRERAKTRRRRRLTTQDEFPQLRGRWWSKAKSYGGKTLTRAEKKESKHLRRWMRKADRERPKDRNECRGAARPCPFVSCSKHLYLDVSPESGSVKINFPGMPVEQALRLMRETCALDVADKGGVTLDEVGVYSNVSMERIRQMEQDNLGELLTKLTIDHKDLYPEYYETNETDDGEDEKESDEGSG